MKRAHPLAKSTWINLRSTKVWATTPETETWALLIDLVTLDKWWSIWPTNWGMGTDMDPSALRRLMVIFNFFARSASFFRWSLVRVRYKEGSHDLGTHCLTKLLQVEKLQHYTPWLPALFPSSGSALDWDYPRYPSNLAGRGHGNHARFYID